MITPALFQTLSAEERKLWHSHVYEVKSGMLVMPNSTVPDALGAQAKYKEMQSVVELYGKAYHLWQTDAHHRLLLGEPQLMASYTADWQLSVNLIEKRDERFKVNYKEKKRQRKDIAEPRIHPTDVLRATDTNGEHVFGAIQTKVRRGIRGNRHVDLCRGHLAAFPAAAILAAYLYRCASAFAALRETVSAFLAGDDKLVHSPQNPQSADLEELLTALHASTYFCFFSCFAEGFNKLRAKEKPTVWHLYNSEIVQLWRAGSITRADGILNRMVIFRNSGCEFDDMSTRAEVTAAMHQRMSSVTRVILAATAADLLLPTLSQSFEHCKYMQAPARSGAVYRDAAGLFREAHA